MKKKKMKVLTVGLSLLTSMTSLASNSESFREDVLGNLYGMRAVYRAEYAPADWKMKWTSYDLENEFKKATEAVNSSPNLTMDQTRQILKNFIYSMKDYHTSISFISTETATLPLNVRSAGDHVYIVYIDRSKLSEQSFPFNVGDELLSFGGLTAKEAIAAVQAETPSNVPETDLQIAELGLTRRRASRGLTVPKGPVTLEILPQGQESKAGKKVQLIWDYTPEKIASRSESKNPPLNMKLMTGTLDSLGQKPSRFFKPRMDVLFDKPKTAENPYGLGTRKSFIPDLGVKLWESDKSSTFYAYIYKAEDRKLMGYVRIAQYEATDYVKAVADFAQIVDRFQKTTDGMVIDQVNNPGGSVFYLYALASMLTDQPLRTPLHRMAINQADVADALTQIADLEKIKTEQEAQKAIKSSELDGYPPSLQFAQFTLDYYKFIVAEWTMNHKLTSPYWIAGVNHINPGVSQYTKPILLLVNHLDFSGGDFFPTILQDNQRVTVMGSRTAGAGGYVSDIKIQNNIGIDSFRCTESIAERIDGNPIENLGVTPDIPYEMTAEDFTQNYAPYVKAINKELSKLTL